MVFAGDGNARDEQPIQRRHHGRDLRAAEALMTLSFPPSPTSGQTYQNWQWDGAKWVPYAAPSVIVTSGNRVLLSKQTVSTAVASVNFAGLLTSTYDLYEVDLYGVQFSANSIGIAARFSSDGGTTWIATASYNYGGWYT